MAEPREARPAGNDHDLAAEDGLTRRQFLIGGGITLGALAVGGAVAQRTLPLRSYYNRLTGQCGPDGPVPPDRASPTYGTFHSDILGEDVDYGSWVPVAPFVPEGYRYPVVYCLPGRGRGPRYVLDGPLYMADFATRPADQAPRMLALVSLYGSHTYWHKRASGEDRLSMLLDEFIPWFEQRNQVGKGRRRRAIMGWSMGGYGAILAAERRPDLFAALCAVSPALWRSYDEGVGDAFDSAADFRQNDVFSGLPSLSGLPLRVDCGRADVFYAAARAFAEACAAQSRAGVSGDVLTPGGEKGCHDPGFWRRVAPREIDFLTGALAS